jgi:hypothetical protein
MLTAAAWHHFPHTARSLRLVTKMQGEVLALMIEQRFARQIGNPRAPLPKLITA